MKISFSEIHEGKKLILSNFHSGNDSIDSYFKGKCEAITDTSAKSFVVTNDNTQNGMPSVIGVYSLCCSGYVIDSHNYFYIHPAVEIKYFAINEYYQDIQYSENTEEGCLSSNILATIIGRIISFTDSYCGANKVILYSVPEAEFFYQRMGFHLFANYMLKNNERYLEGCIPMYLDLDTME
ncbi:Uncharacterised protein [uncultured Ruminococcus sp.]|nr:Uncharacterised protein [uncultured Ruminococcus sp.]